MEFGLDKFFCWQTVALSLLLWFLTFTIRRVLEKAVPQLLDPKSKLSGWWGDVLVPAFPPMLGFGLAAAIVKTFPYPESMQLFWGRVMFGVVCGLLSSKVYQLVWGAMKSKIPDPPAGGPVAP